MMVKKLLAVVIMTFMLCLSCSEEKVVYTAADAAKDYYDKLFAGDYVAFTDGMFFPDSIPEVYREQLVANAKMFAAEHKEAHKGVSRVQAQGYKTDSLSAVTQAFLLFCYGDSLKEEVVVPMVWHEGKWFMK